MIAKPKMGEYSPTLEGQLDWKVVIRGDLIEVKAEFLRPPRGIPKKRGKCKAFTRSSRLRMLKMVSVIDWSSITSGIFVTLTYPDSVRFPKYNDRSKHLYLFCRYLEQHLGKQVGVLWRVEWMKRKSGAKRGKWYPHFHLIIPAVKYVHRNLIRQWWRDTIKAIGPLSTDVKALTDRTHHAVYIAKYAAKLPEFGSLDYVSYLNSVDGRHWGVKRPSLIPKHTKITYDGLSAECIECLKQVAFENLPSYGKYSELGYCMFGKLGAAMKNAIAELCLDFGAEPV